VPYESLIRAIPDFPQKGILFRDITPLLADPEAFQWAVSSMAQPFESQVDAIVAVEARGYIFGAPIAQRLDAAFVPVRKVGKLPYSTFKVDYALEYGIATVEIHQDGVRRGQRVLLVDDLLATGGTLCAAAELVEKAGGLVVGVSVLIELEALKGRQKLSHYPVHTVMKF
jgi:adenine phosphoribosyltransferase